MNKKKFPDVKFYTLNAINESLLKRVVIVSSYQNKWVYCKAKRKNTWEIPGGKIKDKETPLEAAKRELYEETGTVEVEIKPICIYFVFNPGLLCYAKIKKIGVLPDYEMKEIAFFVKPPTNLTYPEIHPQLFNKVIEKLNKK